MTRPGWPYYLRRTIVYPSERTLRSFKVSGADQAPQMQRHPSQTLDSRQALSPVRLVAKINAAAHPHALAQPLTIWTRGECDIQGFSTCDRIETFSDSG